MLESSKKIGNAYHKDHVAEISLSYSPTHSRKVVISNSKKAADVLRKMWDTQKINIQEQFCVLYLNNANEVLGFKCINTGTISSCTVDKKLIFATALKSLSTQMIVAHNHPSGQLTASQEDIKLTESLRQLSNMLDIKLLDHIILTNRNYLSFADQTLL